MAETDLPQVTCQVCETVQPLNWECISCGMKLKLPPGIRPRDPAPDPMPDSEVTSLGDAGEIPYDHIPDLEVTVEERVGAVAVEEVPGYEVVAQDPILDFPGMDDVVPDLDVTSETFEKSAPMAAYPRLCPFCGFEQSEGRLCDSCGRSRIAPRNARAADVPLVRCPGCGSMVLHHELCSDCGSPLPAVQQ